MYKVIDDFFCDLTDKSGKPLNQKLYFDKGDLIDYYRIASSQIPLDVPSQALLSIICDGQTYITRDFDIENSVKKLDLEEIDNLAKRYHEEKQKVIDSMETPEPTELQKEQIRKIVGQKTKAEIILEYLNNVDLNIVNPQVEQWIKQQREKYEDRFETIQFCNASDMDIINAALLDYANTFRSKGEINKADKVGQVRKNYLDMMKEPVKENE